MKPITSALALLVISGFVFAQTPATTGQGQVGPKGPKKQIENKHQGAKAKPNLGTRPASNTGGPSLPE